MVTSFSLLIVAHRDNPHTHRSPPSPPTVTQAPLTEDQFPTRPSWECAPVMTRPRRQPPAQLRLVGANSPARDTQRFPPLRCALLVQERHASNPESARASEPRQHRRVSARYALCVSACAMPRRSRASSSAPVATRRPSSRAASASRDRGSTASIWRTPTPRHRCNAYAAAPARTSRSPARARRVWSTQAQE